MLSNNLKIKMNNLPIKVGITGGMGSGKSHISRIFEDLGYRVFDCDTEAKYIMTHNDEVINEIFNVVGSDSYYKNFDSYNNVVWKLNKPALSKFLFHDKINATKINTIVHPPLAVHFNEWANKIDDKIVFVESAILFESGFNKLVDMILFVYADENMRVNRCVKRDGTSKEDVLRRIRIQEQQDKLIEYSDYIIYNNNNSDLGGQVNGFFKYVSKSFL